MERFGEYVLYEQLGPSERGLVWRATVANGVAEARAVAVKRFPASLFPTAAAASRHAVEVARASRLRHPNIVEVFRVGRVGDTTYAEMEHVDGVSLDELLHDIRTDGPPPVEVAISLVAELAAALELSHDEGVVHGDIRPCHLLIAGSGSLKVLGFGMVQLERSAAQRCYAAPEATAGDPPDSRADLYSLGVVAYELATGRPLFDEHMDPELRGYQGSSIQPPSTCNPDCPPELDALILRALATDPEERWATARELREVIGTIGGPAPDRVRAWLEREGSHSYPPATLSAPQPPADLPAPPKRAARGTGRHASHGEGVANPEQDDSLHDAETVIRPPTNVDRRRLDLPLRAPSEPYLALDVRGESSSSREGDRWSAREPPDASCDADEQRTLLRDERSLLHLDEVQPLLLDGPGPLSVDGPEPFPEDEPTPWPEAGPRLLPIREPSDLRRYFELGIAFLAGAIAMYLAIAWLD